MQMEKFYIGMEAKRATKKMKKKSSVLPVTVTADDIY